MASAGAEFGVPESGNSPDDDPRQSANGDPVMTSPELVLVAGDEEAQRARESLAAIVPTDERINAEVRARAASQLRLAPPAAAAATALPAAAPAAEPRAEPAEAEPVPATVAPAAEPPAKRPRRRVGPAIGLLALVPVAVAGLALGLHWNPFRASTTPTTTAAPAPAPPPTHQVGTATSAGVTTAPATPKTGQAPTAAQTSGGAAPATHPRTTTHPHAATATAPAHTTPAHTTPTHTTPAHTTTPPATATHPKTASRPTRTTRPKPPAKPPTITPSRTFAWAAAPNASFYLVRFARDGTKVFERRVTEPRLTLPASFRFRPGNYRWTVVPAQGTASNPRYAPAIIDSRFIVAG